MSDRFKTFRLSNMTGGMNTMDELTKLVQFDGKKGSEALNIENYLPLRRGGQRTERGYEVYKDTESGAPIRGLYKYYKADGTEKFMVATGGDLYELNTSTLALTSIMSVDSDEYLDFEIAYDYLVVCDGVNNARAWDGSSVTAITTGTPAAPLQSRFYLDRLFMYLDNDSYVYHSDTGDIFAGYSSNFIKCDNDDGSKITGLEKLFVQGQLATALVVGKDVAIGAILGNGTVSNPFAFVQLNQDAGVAGFRSMRQHNQDVSFLTNKGVSSYQLNQTDVNLGYSVLTRNVLDQFLDIDSSSIQDSHVVYDWRNSRLRFFVPEQGQTFPNVVWNYDTELQCWYKSRYPDLITASFVDKEGVQWLGTSTGEILKCSDSVYSFGGEEINSIYATGYMDFGQPTVRKRMIDARVFAQGQGNYGFGIATNLDYGQRVGRSGTITLDGASYKWGDGVWTDDPNVYQWGGTPISISRFIPGGYFYNMNLELTGNSDNEPFDIFSIEMTIEYMDHR